MKELEQFKKVLFEELKNKPKDWRYGQNIFNRINAIYGVARDVQYIDSIECFCNDSLKLNTKKS